MGHQAIVYGRIQETWEGTSVRWPKSPAHNECVLSRLPDEDQVWPFLTRHMFALLPQANLGPDRGCYRGRSIHFAANLKEDPNDPNWPLAFLQKLEQLVLSKLLWRSAKVHFESAFFPERVFVYRSDPESLAMVHAELEMCYFAEQIGSTVTWKREESHMLVDKHPWLY